MKPVNFFIPIFFLLSHSVSAQKDFHMVRQRVVTEIMKAPVNDSLVSDIMISLKVDGTWPDINYQDLSNTGFEHRRHLSNMVSMSRAYTHPKSRYYKNKKIKGLIHRSLKLWCEKDFICENWWFNQIFTPTSLVTVLLVMEDDLDPKLREKAVPIIGRAHLEAPGARPGGDRIKIAGIAAKRALALGDETQFAYIVSVINSEIKFATGNRGMQHDFSFHHRSDRVNTTYSYGHGYAAAFAEWGAYVAGTSYAFSSESVRHLVDYYLDGICKQFVYGVYTDKGVMNRSISRKETFKPHSTSIPEKLLEITDYRKKELVEIIGLRKGKSIPPSSFSKFFWQSEHFVFQRPDFYTSVRLFSIRNRNMEKPYNSEGLKNHHKGDGANFLSINGDEYLNIWPVYDWQKIPGTTVAQKPSLPSIEEIQKDGVTDFVGAVSNGLYGAVAFDFISPHDFTRARKSWFFFDKEYVCLGAGIESTTNVPVITTVNQTHLKGNVTVATVDDKFSLKTGEHEIDKVRWVNHNGVGYIFPKPTEIYVANCEKSGNWFEINKQWDSPNELLKTDVFKLWINHGVRPQGRQGGFNHQSLITKDVKYHYVVVPSAEVEKMDDERGLAILANNRFMQAVKNSNLGITQIIFYRGGELTIADDLTISTDSPAAVMLKVVDKTVKEITVADPSRKLLRMHLRISGRIDDQGKDNLKAIFDSNKNVSFLTINLPKEHYAGQSVKLEW